MSNLGEAGTRYGDFWDAHFWVGDTGTHVRASGIQGRAGRTTGMGPPAGPGPARFCVECQMAGRAPFVQLEAKGLWFLSPEVLDGGPSSHCSREEAPHGSFQPCVGCSWAGQPGLQSRWTGERNITVPWLLCFFCFLGPSSHLCQFFQTSVNIRSEALKQLPLSPLFLSLLHCLHTAIQRLKWRLCPTTNTCVHLYSLPFPGLADVLEFQAHIVSLV